MDLKPPYISVAAGKFQCYVLLIYERNKYIDIISSHQTAAFPQYEASLQDDGPYNLIIYV